MNKSLIDRIEAIIDEHTATMEVRIGCRDVEEHYVNDPNGLKTAVKLVVQLELAQLIEALSDTTAHLIGATSAYATYAGNSERAGVRDAFYNTRLKDFKAACGRARAILLEVKGVVINAPDPPKRSLNRTAQGEGLVRANLTERQREVLTLAAKCGNRDPIFKEGFTRKYWRAFDRLEERGLLELRTGGRYIITEVGLLKLKEKPPSE